jgi:hypothetical protein
MEVREAAKLSARRLMQIKEREARTAEIALATFGGRRA